MIRGLFLDPLRNGQLPVYETYPDARYHVLHETAEGHRWSLTRDLQLQNRVRVPMGIDTTLPTFEAYLRRYVAQAQEFSENGTLLFALHAQSENPENDHHGYVLLGGMVYFPTFNEMSIDLQREQVDAVDLILAFCQGRNDHPLIGHILEGARRHFAADAQAEAEVRRAEEVALQRARRLLDECLTPEQRAELTSKNYIHVRAKTGELFRIYARGHQNVYRIENHVEVMKYCVVIASAGMPVYDVMLAQKLLIEHNFDEFLRLSNKWDLTRERTPHPELDVLLTRFMTDDEIDAAIQFVIEPAPPVEDDLQRQAG